MVGRDVDVSAAARATRACSGEAALLELRDLWADGDRGPRRSAASRFDVRGGRDRRASRASRATGSASSPRRSPGCARRRGGGRGRTGAALARRRRPRGDRGAGSRTCPRTGCTRASRRPQHRVERRAEVVPRTGRRAAARLLRLGAIRDRAAALIERYDVRGAEPADARAAALGRQPAEGRARPRVRRRPPRAVAASPTRGLDVVRDRDRPRVPARRRGQRHGRAPDQRGPGRDPRARRPDRRHVRRRASSARSTRARPRSRSSG